MVSDRIDGFDRDEYLGSGDKAVRRALLRVTTGKLSECFVEGEDIRRTTQREIPDGSCVSLFIFRSDGKWYFAGGSCDTE